MTLPIELITKATEELEKVIAKELLLPEGKAVAELLNSEADIDGSGNPRINRENS